MSAYPWLILIFILGLPSLYSLTTGSPMPFGAPAAYFVILQVVALVVGVLIAIFCKSKTNSGVGNVQTG